ncbi:MAG: hypothetical protein DHS20C12_29810 [Pseudohongiella sp.]|nr:MAG: hypothetical protein DHS20C12_29810 [Pseudohongiella sp.]
MKISNNDKILLVVSSAYFLLVTSFAIRNGYDAYDSIHGILLYGGAPLMAIWGLKTVRAEQQLVLINSAIWFCIVAYLSYTGNNGARASISDLILIGVVPLVIIWGGKWIFQSNDSVDSASG